MEKDFRDPQESRKVGNSTKQKTDKGGKKKQKLRQKVEAGLMGWMAGILR